MYSCNKIKPSKLFDQHQENLEMFYVENNFDKFHERNEFLIEIEKIIKQLEKSYFTEFEIGENSEIIIKVNNEFFS